MKVFQHVYENEFKKYLTSIGSDKLVRRRDDVLIILEECMSISDSEIRDYERSTREKLKALEDYSEYAELYIRILELPAVEFGEMDLEDSEYLSYVLQEATERWGD